MSEVVVEHKGAGSFEARWGTASVPVDAQASPRGSLALAPLPLFAASLGSCIGAFVAGYCANAGIDTAGMTVTVGFEKVGTGPGERARLGKLSARIRMPPGTALGKRGRAVLAAAEGCILHQTLKGFDGLDISLDAGPP